MSIVPGNFVNQHLMSIFVKKETQIDVIKKDEICDAGTHKPGIEVR
jgi:hypothetical protein